MPDQSSNISDAVDSTDVPSTFDEVVKRYESKLADQNAIVRNGVDHWKRIGFLRGGTFLLSLVPIGLAVAQVGGVSTPWLWLAGLIFLAFLVVAFFHEGLQANIRRATLMADYYRESLARCRCQWKQIEVPKIEIPASFQAVSTDLDLLGASSIYKLLGITRTPLGVAMLQQWIMHGALPDEVHQRQEAVEELKPTIEWREKFWLSCEELSTGRTGPGPFVDWSESESWFAGRDWLLWLVRGTSLISLIGLIGVFLLSGLFPGSSELWILGIGCTANFLLSVFYAGSIHDVFNKISTRADEANHYLSLFDRITGYPAQSRKLLSLQTRLHGHGHAARGSLHSLGRLMTLANLRRGAISFFSYVVLEFLFFWDVHVLHLLEKWKLRHGADVRDWFDVLGEWEALCALAKLAADQPDWTFPDVVTKQSQESSRIVAENMGHPLLDQNRVPSSVQVGPSGTVLLVTGSNMSGKSTLLRSIGTNVVLAQMGSVVCANTLTLSPMRIETSMRIADSLADGVSFFMAELKRLKEIVDRASDSRDDSEHTFLFLLDEILQGTNSRERQIAVSRVVRKLIDENAIGAISTHDLDLATTDELSQACRTVHFSEQFTEVDGQKKMTFDYQMRQGLAETTNALKLLEMVGL